MNDKNFLGGEDENERPLRDKNFLGDENSEEQIENIESTSEEEDTKKQEPQKGTGKKKWWIIIACAVAAIVLIVALVIVPMTTPPERPVRSEPLQPTITPTAQPTPTLTVSASKKPSPTPSKKPEILADLKDLYEENNDLAGWLKIDDTIIDYPVMYSKEDDGEYYLYRTFTKDKDPTKQGCLFIDENCSLDPRSTNLLIHGHNMKNGTMFHSLLDYADEEFYKEHPIINYSSLWEDGEYEIVSVFRSKIYNKTDDVFKFYKFYNAKNEKEFNDFIDNIKELELYDTGVDAKYGDELITLATCEYTVENGRFVVVARKKAN